MLHPHTRNPFDRRTPADPSTEDFLRKLQGSEASDAYREAMGEQASKSPDDTSVFEFTPDELALALAAEVRLRDTKEKKGLATLKADYLAWAREFKLGDNHPEQWISDTFTFNPDGTVEVDGNLDLPNKSLTRLPRNLTRVGGRLNISDNHLTTLDGLPRVVNGDLHLSRNGLTTLDGLKGRQIDGSLFLIRVPTTDIPDGIELGGGVTVGREDTVLATNARGKGYEVAVW